MWLLHRLLRRRHRPLSMQLHRALCGRHQSRRQLPLSAANRAVRNPQHRQSPRRRRPRVRPRRFCYRPPSGARASLARQTTTPQRSISTHRLRRVRSPRRFGRQRIRAHRLPTRCPQASTGHCRPRLSEPKRMPVRAETVLVRRSSEGQRRGSDTARTCKTALCGRALAITLPPGARGGK